MCSQWSILTSERHKRNFEYKGILGSEVHDVIEARSLALDVDCSPECAGYVASWQKWIETTKCTIELTEHRLYDDELMITGKFDALVRFPEAEVLTLIDYKTCAQVMNKSWNMQGNFYHYLATKNNYALESRVLFLKLSETGALPKVCFYGATANMLNVCRAAVTTYKYINNI